MTRCRRLVPLIGCEMTCLPLQESFRAGTEAITVFKPVKKRRKGWRLFDDGKQTMDLYFHLFRHIFLAKIDLVTISTLDVSFQAVDDLHIFFLIKIWAYICYC